MIELSEENQRWLNSIHFKPNLTNDRVIYVKDVEKKILELESQLQQANSLKFKYTSEELPEGQGEFGSDSILFVLHNGFDYLGYWDSKEECFVFPEYGERYHKSRVSIWANMTHIIDLIKPPKED